MFQFYYFTFIDLKYMQQPEWQVGLFRDLEILTYLSHWEIIRTIPVFTGKGYHLHLLKMPLNSIIFWIDVSVIHVCFKI